MLNTSSRDRKLHCVSINHNDFDLDDSPNNCKCNIAGLYCGSDIFPGNAAGGLETADFNKSSHRCRGCDTKTLSLDAADEDKDLNRIYTMLFRYWVMKCSRTPEGAKDLPLRLETMTLIFVWRPLIDGYLRAQREYFVRSP